MGRREVQSSKFEVERITTEAAGVRRVSGEPGREFSIVGKEFHHIGHI